MSIVRSDTCTGHLHDSHLAGRTELERSFLEVGMTLKEIRDKRLYRQQYDTFEEYCARRWELSRPRSYQLCEAWM